MSTATYPHLLCIAGDANSFCDKLTLMKIEGDYSLKASPAIIWEKLLDTETLARITPGVTHLEMTEPDQFIATSEIKIGPVQGAFKGNLAIKDKKEPEGFTLVLSQKSKIGNASAEVKLNILPQENEETKVRYEGKAKLSGLLARTGQRVIGGVVKTLAKQFFKALEVELNGPDKASTESAPAPAAAAAEEAPKAVDANIPPAPPPPPPSPPPAPPSEHIQ